MRRVCLFLVAVLALSLADVHLLFAQLVSTTSVTVSARVVGTFGVTVNTENFDFGVLDASGVSPGGPNVAAKGGGSDVAGEVYENTPGSITWACRAAPTGTVDVALISSLADHTGGMHVDDLEVRIPSTAGGTSTGYQAFTSGATLITGMAVGNGTNAVSGALDLRLTVLDADPVGANTWVVRLRATANP